MSVQHKDRKEFCLVHIRWLKHAQPACSFPLLAFYSSPVKIIKHINSINSLLARWWWRWRRIVEKAKERKSSRCSCSVGVENCYFLDAYIISGYLVYIVICIPFTFTFLSCLPSCFRYVSYTHRNSTIANKRTQQRFDIFCVLFHLTHSLSLVLCMYMMAITKGKMIHRDESFSLFISHVIIKYV